MRNEVLFYECPEVETTELDAEASFLQASINGNNNENFGTIDGTW